MPELPDLTFYCEALETRILGQPLESAALASPFLLRTVDPPLDSFIGLAPAAIRLLGKRICIGFPGDSWLAIHLMILGRLHWNRRAGKPLLTLMFASGALTLTESGSERRASLHAFPTSAALQSLDAGGKDPLSLSLPEFEALARSENHTLKRFLTGPEFLSGIGNAYSDEILHRARLSPLALTHKLAAEELARLHAAMRAVLAEWTARLREEARGGFPEKVTAFRPEMAVHGKFKQPCPACGTKVQRICYAANETNYCPLCQTGGRLLADRAMSRLLKQDWPRTIGQA
jgi:formamidopyrimidine-DNA glycosylase